MEDVNPSTTEQGDQSEEDSFETFFWGVAMGAGICLLVVLLVEAL